MRAVKGLLSLAVGFAVSSALAADWFIPDGDLVALTNAFKQLAAGDTVTLAKGTYDFSAHPEIYMSLNTGDKYATVITNRLAINSKQNITLRGEPGASRDEVIVNGGSARLLYINGSSQSGLVVTNLTLTNFAAGYKASEGLGDTATYRGSVIHSSKGTTIADCVIRDCKAGYAALYGAGIVCRDSVLTNCVGSSYSGAAVLGTYYNCRFIGNSNESGSGGAAAQISASNCWFEANVAAISGGAVLGGTVVNAGSAGSSCILEDCVFTNNTANGVTSADKGQLGGGAYATATFNPTKKDVYPDIFRRCHFYGNSAEVGGAVLTGSGSKSTTTDSVVPASFADCDFSGNEAGKRGGAAAEGFYIAKDAAEDAQRGLTISNCTFSANVVTGGLSGGNRDESTGFANITGGGALFGANAVDSTFEDCSAVYFGGAVIGGSFIGCTFTGNGVTVASGRNYGGGVGYRIEFASNCTFRANGRNAGAISGELLLNCKEFHLTVFQDNLCTNRGFGLVCASLPGMSFTDCTFTNSPNNRGGATIENDCPTSRAQLVRCKFFDCLQPKYDGLFGGTDDKINGWAAYGCDAVDCFFGDGALETVSGDCGCSATRCVFQGIAPTRAAIFYGNAGRIALTNCLICNCVAAPGAATFRNVDLVNCTVVGNTYNDGFRLTNSVVNCILSGNTRDGEASDLYHRIHADSLLMVQNCVYGINSQTLDVSSFADLGGCVALGTASPGFNLDKNPNFPYYSLRRSSRACRAGTNAAAFAGTVDLAGNPRVHGEGPYTVDAGCYECWIPPMGLLLLFR